LFDEIPNKLRAKEFTQVPSGISELALNRMVSEKTRQIGSDLCFIGGGAYEHHIPACVWDIAFRGEFLTAYTPYQAEASQGSLQLIYEYQTMMSGLTGMDVSNASLYDGASAMAEALLMAVRANRQSKSKRIILLGAIHPHYVDTARTIVTGQGIELICAGFDSETGAATSNQWSQFVGEDIAAVVVSQPNFLGSLEQVDDITNFAHEQKALVIAVVNPMSLGLLKPPGEWGNHGADIVCGEGQPMGIPLASGGPYFGFMTAKKSLVRHMPGRIVGRTVDEDGREGFTLTLQAREQHIRRSKATSNICTNQGLLVTGATIYMSVMGFEGIASAATASHLNTQSLLSQLLKIDGVSQTFSSPYFHEVVVTLPVAADKVIEKMHEHGIACGLSLEMLDSQYKKELLVCVTETKTEAELALYASTLKQVIDEVSLC
jgi:glycine dehydrogenase subunit 1